MDGGTTRDAGSIAVLVVDDHTMVAEAIVTTLDADPGIRVVGCAHNVADALDAAASESPDVVVMDFRLPDGDGIDATRRLKREHPDTEVILLTGFADDATLVRAVEAGCVGMLAKEHGVGELVAAVHAAGVGRSLVDPSVVARLASRMRAVTADRPELTPRECEILQLLADGVATDEIARRLVLSRHTVRNHIRNVLAKMNAHSRLEAVAMGVQHRLVTMSRSPA